MSAALGRSILAALLAITLWAGAQLTYSIFFCRPHAAFAAASDGRRDVVLDRGERVARWGDAVYTCTTTHHIGPVRLHDDLDCYCAPQTTSAARLGEVVGGYCEIDHLLPTRADDFGACRFARCNRHVDP